MTHWLRRVYRVAFPRRDDAAVEAELRLHVDLETEDLVRRGVPPEDARRQALVAFGGVERVREEARDARRLGWLDALQFDVRHALRSLRRTPGLTLVIIATLAVGVGANASLYALVDALMFRPPDEVRDPERLVSANTVSNYVRYLDVSRQSTTLEAAAYTRIRLSLGAGVDAAPVRAECVTASYFPVLGAKPALGRVFSQDPAAETREPAVVLADGFWQREFSARRDIIGQTVAIAARTYTVAGVMPPRFTGVQQEPVDVWLLLPISPEACSFTGRNLLRSSGGSWLNTIGRLAHGVTLAQAEADLTRLASPDEVFRRAARRSSGETIPELTPLHESRRSRVARDAGLAVWLLGGAGVVLLIACANVAGLLSIRSLDRRRETTVRLQLGAGRGRILRQFIVELILVSMACGTAAVAVSSMLNRMLATFFPYAVVSDAVDGRVFPMAVALALSAGAASGLVPAWQTSRIRATTFSQSVSGILTERSRVRSTLLVFQVAMAFTLVAGGGLFARSVQNTRHNLGYTPDGLYVVAADLARAGFRNPIDIRQAFDAMAARIRQTPGVESVGMSSGSFMGSGGAGIARPGGTTVTAVSREYFTAFGSRLLRGRPFSEADTKGATPVAIIDEGLARDEWPGEDAIGKCGFGSGPDDCRAVVGIVESRRTSVGSTTTARDLLIPFTQATEEQVPQLLFVRTGQDVPPAHAAIAAAARAAVSNLPYVTVRSFDDLADVQTRSWRLGQTMFGLFGAVGVLLSALGLYAVLALAAKQRTAEIGVRMALGARPTDIARLVARHAARFVGIGWLAGIAMAILSTRYIEHLLFRVAATDPAAFALASLVVFLTGAAGCALPAYRAARLSPVKALRHE